MTRRALAVDIGGTELRVAVVDETGALHASAATPTDSRGGPHAVMPQTVRLADRVRDEARRPSLAGAGIAAPGPLDPVDGIAIAPPTLAGWHEVPLAKLLQERLRMPVLLENVANAAALGEWRYGA